MGPSCHLTLRQQGIFVFPKTQTIPIGVVSHPPFTGLVVSSTVGDSQHRHSVAFPVFAGKNGEI